MSLKAMMAVGLGALTLGWSTTTWAVVIVEPFQMSGGEIDESATPTVEPSGDERR